MTTVPPVTAVTPMTAAVPGARTAPGQAGGSHRTDAARLVEGLRRRQPLTVVDVRTPEEFAAAHVEGAVNVPLDLLVREAGPVAARLRGDVVVMCAAGGRAERARELLVAAGATAPLQVLGGGVDDVRRAGGVVVLGRQRWSLERQAGLLAGSTVLLGVAAGRALPAARHLPTAVATALVVGALRGTTTTTALLSRLPHNRPTREPALDEVLARLDDAAR